MTYLKPMVTIKTNVNVGTGDIDKSNHTLEGASVEGNVNIDNSKTINKGCSPSRFASAAAMRLPETPQNESKGLEM